MRRLMTTDATLKTISCVGTGVMAAGLWAFFLEYLSDRQEARRG